MNKIVTIRTNIAGESDVDALQDAQQMMFPESDDKTLSSFEPATEDEVKKLLTKTSSATCALDPLPTPLLKECSSVLLPILTKIINLSLSGAEVPLTMKQALVKPLLKKTILDPEILKNYRPISNLSFVSKLIERIVASRLETHLTVYKLLEPNQSAYRRFHSTESALLRVQNDLLTSLNKNKMAILVLLDLSAAFDTIDHDLLLHRMSTRYGIVQTALQWFKSYLSNRSQIVTIGKKSSEPMALPFGVPQGSVLGPILFTIYTTLLYDIARKYE